MIRMIAAIRATITAVALLAGVPILLVALGGSPLPDHTPSAAQVQAWLDDPLLPQYGPGTARAVAWLIWALLATLILTAWVLRARRWRWARLAAYLPGPTRGLAATLLGAATVTTAVGIPPAHAAAPATTGDTATPDHTSTALPAAAVTADHQGRSPGTESPTITVHRGDTLWDIAADRLGDPHRWQQIYRLNASRHADMGRGEHIEPGWTLALPTGTAVPGHRPPRPGTVPTRPAPANTAPTPPPPGAGCTAAPAPGAAIASTGAPSTTPTPTPTAASTGTPQHAPAPERGATATRRGRDTDRPEHPTSGISLPGGSWIDLGLATAISAAAALIWAHRRRRYSRHPLSANLRLNDPDLTPMPPVVDQIRRWLHRGAPDSADTSSGTDRAERGLPTDPQTTDEHSGTADPAASLDSDDPGGRRDDRDDQTRGEEHDTVGEDIDDRRLPDEPSPHPRPAAPSLAHPLAGIWPSAGLGLVGPGAEAAARGFLTAALAAGGVDAPDERSWVVMPSAVAATLLAARAVALPHTPRLSVTGGLDEALDLLEAQTLHRSRILDAHDVDTVAELRAGDPGEQPLPPMMLLADAATGHRRTRIAALLTQGGRLDIHGVLLGTWPDGNTIEVAADGTTTPADGERSHGGAHPADIGRLTVLTPAETSDLLQTLAESHTGQQQAPAAIGPAAGTTPDTDGAGHAATTVHAHHDEPATTLTAPPSPAAGSLREAPDEDRLIDDARQELEDPAIDTSPYPADGEARPKTMFGRHEGVPSDVAGAYSAIVAPEGEGTDAQPAVGQTGDEDTAEAEASETGRAEVTVLGPAGILGLPTGIAPRKKSLELLVYLAVHDGEASAEAILDDVLGDVAASKAPGRLYTYVSDLRTVLRRVAGRGTYISHPGHRYVLNRDLVDVDLWRMQAAIRDAALATLVTDPAERRTALRRAVDTYTGPLADGADYEWIEPYREAVRQQALDAFLALSDALADTPAEQITVLDAAIRHNPYTEHLYQQAMNTRAKLGHLDAIRDLRRALTRALDEIDAEPTDETITLADHLVAQTQHAGRPELRRATRHGHGAAA
jgi:DNA-binding SARP family transcriptional activator